MKKALLCVFLFFTSIRGSVATYLELVEASKMDLTLDRTGVMHGIVSEISAYGLFGACLVREVRPVVFTAVYLEEAVFEYALCHVIIELTLKEDLQKAGESRQEYLILVCRNKYREDSLWELRTRTGDYSSKFSHVGVLPLEKGSTNMETLWEFLERWNVLEGLRKKPSEKDSVGLCFKVYKEIYAQILKGTAEKDFFNYIKDKFPDVSLPNSR